MVLFHPRRLHAAVLCTAAFFCLAGAVQAAWIPAKAQLAQWLLASAWQQRLNGEPVARPWPWADTYPVMKLRAPRLGIEHLVLSGDSGRNLAFGPALHGASTAGLDLVISGHRDTHFSYLQSLLRGDRLELETPDGKKVFEVAYSEVIDSSQAELVITADTDRLSLVTCYPFDTPLAGGPLRYVITALPVAAFR